MLKFWILLLITTLFSCTKNEGNAVTKIWYSIELPNEYSLDITYYSDKYFETGIQDTFNINNIENELVNQKFWKAERFQNNREDGYYLWAKINKLDGFDNDEFTLRVFANDSSLIDSLKFNSSSNTIQISGEIPKNF